SSESLAERLASPARAIPRSAISVDRPQLGKRAARGSAKLRTACGPRAAVSVFANDGGVLRPNARPGKADGLCAVLRGCSAAGERRYPFAGEKPQRHRGKGRRAERRRTKIACRSGTRESSDDGLKTPLRNSHEFRYDEPVSNPLRASPCPL